MKHRDENHAANGTIWKRSANVDDEGRSIEKMIAVHPAALFREG